MTTALQTRIAASLERPVESAVRAFAEHLAETVGAETVGTEAAGSEAVLFYGSNLRTGSLDGVLDYYVLTRGKAERGIWPKVSYHEWSHDGRILRAKVATMTLARFREAASGRLVDTTIWARFVQPSALVWQSGDQANSAVLCALGEAARTAARLAVVTGPPEGREEDYWTALFRATYKAELRVESAGREQSIIGLNRAHFDGLLPLALDDAGIGFNRRGDLLAPRLDVAERRSVLRWWHRRRRLGKPLNLLRLMRASATFDGAGRYAAWKIERHTGVKVVLTPWRERHPVLAAPGVLWSVWRARRRAG